MVNYQNGKIYRIVSNQTDRVYIGSTCNPLSKRMAEHRLKYRLHLAGEYPRMTSFDIVLYDDAVIVLIEDCPCENKEQLFRRERFHIEAAQNCVNHNIPGRTREEYYADNKEEIAAKHKEYCEANKEAVAVMRKTYREANQQALLAQKKVYYAANKEAIAQRDRVYKEANRVAIDRKRTEIIDCECGCKVTRAGISIHRKTKKHIDCLAKK